MWLLWAVLYDSFRSGYFREHSLELFLLYTWSYRHLVTKLIRYVFYFRHLEYPAKLVTLTINVKKLIPNEISGHFFFSLFFFLSQMIEDSGFFQPWNERFFSCERRFVGKCVLLTLIFMHDWRMKRKGSQDGPQDLWDISKWLCTWSCWSKVVQKNLKQGRT